MPTLTFTFDTGIVPLGRIVDAIASVNGYSATLKDGTPNPQTQAQFAREFVKKYIVSTVRDYEREQARASAVSTVADVNLI